MWWSKKRKASLDAKDISEIVPQYSHVLDGATITIPVSTFHKLKREFIKPYLHHSWDRKHAIEAQWINKALETKGEKVRQAWERYKEQKLLCQRTGAPSATVDAKLEVLEVLMEGVDV